MSTILDSLKKSSEQRDGKDKTAINNFSFGNDKKSENKSSVLIILILLLILIGIAYWGYLSFFDNRSDNNANEATKTSNTETNQLPKLELLEGKTNIVENKKQKPDSKEVKQKIQDIKNQEQTQKLADLKKAQKPRGTTNPDNNNQAEPVTQFELEKEEDPIAETSQPAKPDSSKKEQQPKQEPIQKQRNYLFAYELPFSIRKDLPKLILNIHVYDKDPENRIAIINGVKYVIDDIMEEEVLIKDIVQDGVILDFGGNEFLIPKL